MPPANRVPFAASAGAGVMLGNRSSAPSVIVEREQHDIRAAID
jgi:hypothetical protein